MAEIPVYAELPIATEPDDLIQDAFSYIRSQIPGWIAAEAAYEVILLYAFALIGAEVGDLANDVPPGAYKFFGATIAGIPPVDPSPAAVASTWTVKDNAGYTIPDGALVAIGAPGSNNVLFEAQGAVTIPPGSNSTGVGQVILEAVQPGQVGNDLVGPVNLVDALDFVSSITLVGSTSGGADEETDSAYIARLRIDLSLQSPRPILPDDFALLARNRAGVFRATAVDGYNPTNNTYANERMVAVAAVDANGNAVAGTVMDDLEAYLQDMRETNFIVNVISPTYTAVDVLFQAVALPGWNTVDVHDRIIINLQNYLSPALWGVLPQGEVPGWVNIPVVRINKIIQIIENTDGVDYAVVGSIQVGRQKTGTVSAATNNVTIPAHTYVNGDQVIVRSITGGAPLVAGNSYYVVGAATDTFQLSLTSGGAAIDVTADATSIAVTKMKTTDVTLDGAVPLPLPGIMSGSVS